MRAAGALGVVICGLIAGGGCRETPPGPPQATIAAPEPLVAARQTMARGDHAGAVSLLQEALRRQPTDVEAHYRLGVATSHLDQMDEADREFEWVATHGETDAPEVKIAREWLTARRTSTADASTVGASPAPPLPQRPELASLSGRAVGRDSSASRMHLFLKGLPRTAVEKEFHPLRTDHHGAFHFPNVVPGEYMLTDAMAGPVRWRLKVELGAGERRTLDLLPANDATVRDDFPQSS